MESEKEKAELMHRGEMMTSNPKEHGNKWIRTKVVKRKMEVMLTIGLRSDGTAWANWILADDPKASPEYLRKEFDKLLKRKSNPNTHSLDLYKGKKGFVEEG